MWLHIVVYRVPRGAEPGRGISKVRDNIDARDTGYLVDRYVVVGDITPVTHREELPVS